MALCISNLPLWLRKKFAGLSAEHYTIYVKTHFQNQPRNSPGVKSSPPPQPSPSEGGGLGWGGIFAIIFLQRLGYNSNIPSFHHSSLILFHYKIFLRPKPSRRSQNFSQLIPHEKCRRGAAGHVIGEMFVLFLAVPDGELDTIGRL